MAILHFHKNNYDGYDIRLEKTVAWTKKNPPGLAGDYKQLIEVRLLDFFSAFYQHGSFVIDHFCKTTLNGIRGSGSFIF